MSTGIIDQALNYLGDFDSAMSDPSYCKLPNGVVIMWGAIAVNNGSSTSTINFPVTVTNKDYLTVQVTPLSQGDTWNVNYNDATTSSISVGRLPTNSTRYAYWLVIGFWK